MTSVNSSPQNGSLPASAAPSPTIPQSGKLANRKCACLCTAVNSLCNLFGYYKKEDIDHPSLQDKVKIPDVAIDQPPQQKVTRPDMARDSLPQQQQQVDVNAVIRKRVETIVRSRAIEFNRTTKKAAKEFAEQNIDSTLKGAADGLRAKCDVPVIGGCLQSPVNWTENWANRALKKKAEGVIDNTVDNALGASERTLMQLLDQLLKKIDLNTTPQAPKRD